MNEHMNKSFFSFVSDYRIQLAKDLMTAPKTRNMPIVDLALEVGFKSKSSFYNVFKKNTQMTPSQFKKTVASQ
ncbi:MAG: helix-turn-helix domain-containing protein [Halioglobus sp.]